MYLRIVEKKHKGKVYRQAIVVEGVRIGKKVVQRMVKNLGPVKTDKDLANIRELAEKLKHGEELISLKDLDIKRFEEFGTTYVIESLWKELGMPEIMCGIESRASFPFEKVAFALVSNRLSYPGSEARVFEWIKRDVFIEGKDRIAEQHLYRTLDLLIANKEMIERAIFERLKNCIDMSKVFYDLTSSYFEGNTCLLAEFGYSRDKKRGKRQLVLGIVLADGLPIVHFVFPGSTADKTTLKQTVEYLQDKFKVKRVIFVSDRGLISKENLQLLEQSGYEHIIATKRRTGKLIKKLMLKRLSEKDRISDKLFARKVFENRDRKFILCLNKERALEELEKLESFVEKVMGMSDYGKKLSDKQAVLLKTKLGNNARLFRLNENLFELDRKAYEYEKKIAGRFLLVTTTKLSQSEIVKAYKQLTQVENAFRELKSFIKLRPMFHWKEDRVKAHVFVCVLAFLVESLIQKKLNISPRSVLEELKRISAAVIRINNREVRVLTTLNDRQKEILNSLKIEEPLRIF